MLRNFLELVTMFTALLEKLQRREDLTVDEAAARDGRRSWTASAQPAQIAGLLVGLAMKGERPDEIVGLARTMRARATRLSRTSRAGVRHVRHRRRRRAHLQRLDRRGARARGVRRAASPSTATVGVEPLRQRRRVRGARRQRRGAARRRRALPRRGGHRVPVRADVPSVDAARRADAPRARRAHRVQPARAADQSGRRGAAAGRRAAARADRAGRAIAGAARLRARLGRARRRRARRDLDDRLHEGVGVPRRRGATRSTCTRPTSGCRRRRPRRCAAAMPPRTRRSRGACSPASRARSATSCCSTPARRCSSPGTARRSRTGIAAAAEAIDSGARGGDARARWSPSRSAARRQPRMTTTATPDLLATIVAATRRDRRGPRRRACRVDALASAAAGAAAARRRRSTRRCATAPAPRRHRRVQAPVAVARHPARTTTTRPRIARALRGGRRGGDLGADRADVLRRRARRTCAAVRAAVRRPAPAQGLHRRSRTSCSRRARPAPTPCC